LLGAFKKLNINPMRLLKELRSKKDEEAVKVGDQVTVEIFQKGELVNVRGVSKGKGFQGGVKRWNWSIGPKAHGSMSHRAPGSIGSNTTPGRVFRGHHMPGHMGNALCSVKNLEIVKIVKEENLLALKGAIPGAQNNSYIVITKTGKMKKEPVAVKQKKDEKAEKKQAKPAAAAAKAPKGK